MNIPNYKSFACLMAALALSTGAQAAKFSDYELKTAVFWEFNDDSNPDTAVDSVGGVVGTLQGTADESAMAVYTEDAGGRTGEAGDKAVDFSQAGAGPSIVVDDVDWLNELTAGNRMSISFWQQLTEVTAMTVMKGASPTSSGSERGFSMHTPWSDSTIYFDTAGCCDGATQRVSRNISGLIADYDEIEAFDFTEKWHHFVFIKNGNTKEIWIDGLLFLRGTNTSPLPTDFRQFVMGSSLNGAESMQGFLDDVAFFNGVLVSDEIKQLAGGLKASDLMRDVDSDNDGLPTAYEKAVGLDSDVSNEGVDSDLDGLSDLEEFGLDTNPLLADTDGDGIDDKAEVDAGTNPLSRDTDGDGIDDKSETNTGTFVSATDTGTDPVKADTDGDLWPDGLEIKYNGNALDATIVPLKKGDQNLIAYFNFNSNSPSDAAVDSVFGIEGEFRGRAEDPENGVLATSPVYSAAGEGASGNSGDRAVYFGSGSEQEHLFIEDGSFMSLTAPYDEMTISFWQKLDAIAGTFSFFGFSPSANGPNRGVSAHVPWSNANIYFDSSGCCTANTQRVNRDANAFFDQYSEEFPDILNFSFSDWHHYAFIKRGGRKEVYVDGLLFMSSNGALPLPADFTRFFIGAGPNGDGSLQGYIDDFAVYASALFPLEVEKLAEGASPTSLDRSRDADNDGMSDILEEIAGLDITRNDAGDDEDKDGVVNSKELENGTDPFDADSDDDGLSDGVESDTGTWVSSSDTGTNPLVADTDGDGLSDGVETNTGVYVSRTDTGTNPLNVDSDNDNFLDGLEVIAKSGPNDSSSTPLVNGQVNLLVYWDFNNPMAISSELNKLD
ncbi:MAG: hypothetical protein LR011_07515 [Verrucomicrobia bacterium]|nr:hypothetical protein [Verrucomicrobiota bacterium]